MRCDHCGGEHRLVEICAAKPGALAILHGASGERVRVALVVALCVLFVLALTATRVLFG